MVLKIKTIIQNIYFKEISGVRKTLSAYYAKSGKVRVLLEEGGKDECSVPEEPRDQLSHLDKS